MYLKILKAMIMWAAIISLYMAAKVAKLDFIFSFIMATFFIPIISKIINDDRYNQLAIKRECLRAVYDLTKYLKSPAPDGKQRPIANSYPALDKAVGNAGVFVDGKIANIMYEFYDAIQAKDHERINSINVEYLKYNLESMNKKTSLGNYLINEVAIPVAVDLPSQILTVNKIKDARDS